MHSEGQKLSWLTGYTSISGRLPKQFIAPKGFVTHRKNQLIRSVQIILWFKYQWRCIKLYKFGQTYFRISWTFRQKSINLFIHFHVSENIFYRKRSYFCQSPVIHGEFDQILNTFNRSIDVLFTDLVIAFHGQTQTRKSIILVLYL